MRLKANRLSLWIWYRGTAFGGFQSQRKGDSVQERIEAALQSLGAEGHPVSAGRTDKGVSARMQIVRVNLASQTYSPEDVAQAFHTALFPDGGVRAVALAHPLFHPQWSAVSKEYRYRLSLTVGESVAPLRWNEIFGSSEDFVPPWRVLEHPRLVDRAFDRELFRRALAAAEGERDFSAFHPKDSPIRLRRLVQAEVVEESSDVLLVRLVGNAFARHQVRYLVGGAALVATGANSLEEFQAALVHRSPFGGLRAPPEPLALWEILYPPELRPFVEPRPDAVKDLSSIRSASAGICGADRRWPLGGIRSAESESIRTTA